MNQNTKQIIITTQPEAAVIALNEIQKLDAQARRLKFLTREAQLVSIPNGYSAFLSRLKDTRLIFARHLFPAQYIIPLTHGEQEEAAIIADNIAGLLPLDIFPQSQPFTVQMRESTKGIEADEARHRHALSIIRQLECALTQAGFRQDNKEPCWAVTLFIHENTLYTGASLCADNRSAWNGGEMRFKKDANFISRAEFKLLEAFSVFGMTARQDGTASADISAPFRALDLGAAPGGWTQTLLNMGCQVTAVDPAALNERLTHHPKLFHARDTAQRFLHSKYRLSQHKNSKFQLIVNDMRIEPAESCRIMLDMFPLLDSCGKALMTLKLIKGHWFQQTIKALNLLEKSYRIIDARQLFHNRDEVTVCLSAI